MLFAWGVTYESVDEVGVSWPELLDEEATVEGFHKAVEVGRESLP